MERRDLKISFATFAFTHAGRDAIEREWTVTKEPDEHALRLGFNVTIRCVAVPRLRMSARLTAMPDGSHAVDKCFPQQHELWAAIGAEDVGVSAARTLIEGLNLRQYE